MLYMQGDNNNEYSFAELLTFIVACVVLLIELALVAGAFGHALSKIVSYPEYTTYDNGWFTLFLCIIYLFLFYQTRKTFLKTDTLR